MGELRLNSFLHSLKDPFRRSFAIDDHDSFGEKGVMDEAEVALPNPLERLPLFEEFQFRARLKPSFGRGLDGYVEENCKIRPNHSRADDLAVEVNENLRWLAREHAVGNSREGVAFNEVDAAHLERRRDGAEDVLRSVNHIAALEFYRIIWLTNFVAENRADVLPDRTRLVVWFARLADDVIEF